MSLEIRFLLTMIAIFPAVIGLYKYNKVDKEFHPFIFIMWLEFLIEIFNYLSKKISTIQFLHYIFLNAYTILNFSLFLLLALNFKYISKIKLSILITFAVIIGLVNLNLIHFSGILYYLLFFVSLITLAISIDILTKQIMAIKQPLVNNFWFWMGGTSILYNAQLLVIFGTYVWAIHSVTLGYIFTFVNAACYILNSIAMLKMPKSSLTNN